MSIWPEWTEAELATEKWDLGGGGAGKGRDKGKAGHVAGVMQYQTDGGDLIPQLHFAAHRCITSPTMHPC